MVLPPSNKSRTPSHVQVHRKCRINHFNNGKYPARQFSISTSKLFLEVNWANERTSRNNRFDENCSAINDAVGNKGRIAFKITSLERLSILAATYFFHWDDCTINRGTPF